MGVELNSTPIVSYEYDSASRLIKRVEGGTTTAFHWDGWDLIKEVKSGVINETTNYLVPFGEVLAFERGGDWFYLHGDGLSSTQLITDENGDQVARLIYGAWGEELYASETIPGIFENRFVGGLGCRKDAATGLIYMRHRWYDCQLQRFISRDPIGLRGGANLYEYVEGRPNDAIDPSGLVCSAQPDSPWEDLPPVKQTPAPVSPTPTPFVLEDSFMNANFQVIRPLYVVEILVSGICDCPPGHSPVRDSGRARQVDYKEYRKLQKGMYDNDLNFWMYGGTIHVLECSCRSDSSTDLIWPLNIRKSESGGRLFDFKRIPGTVACK